jgi:hypothetical protein
MRLFMKIVLALTAMMLPVSMLAQNPAVPVFGPLGTGGPGYPLINSPAVIFASDANHTMVYPELSGSGGFLKVTSSVSLTAQRNLVAPLATGYSWTIDNATTGAQAILVIGTTGTGTVIANGVTQCVVSNGTNITTCNPVGGGVTAVSVATANGLQGTSSGGTTPVLTLSPDSTHVIPTNTGISTTFLNGAGAYTAPAGSGTVSGQALNVIGKGTNATTTGAQSALTDNGATITSTEPIVAPSISTGTSPTCTGTGIACFTESATAGTPTAGVDYLRADSVAHQLKSSVNGLPEANVVSITTPATSTHCAEFGPDGVKLIDSGVGCTGSSSAIKYVSQLGCAFQNTDLTTGGGTDDTACINTALATATPTHPILLWQDGASLISGNGIQIPIGGNVVIRGNGGGITTTDITSCGITTNVATFVTRPNALVVGQHIQMQGLTNCAALDTSILTVNAGVTSTGFTANVVHANIATAADLGIGATVYGTGFYLASNSLSSVISNGVIPGVAPYAAANCEVQPGYAPPSRGTNVGVSDLVINGNGGNQTTYCHGIQFQSVNNFLIDNVTIYNGNKYSIELDNAAFGVVRAVTVFAALAAIPATTTDGVHIEGNSNDIAISDSHFHTGDDVIALNSTEGFCGPISRITVNNVSVYNSFNFLRMYNDDVAVCANGQIPLIDTVEMNNFSGTSYTGKFLEAGYVITGLGTLNPAIKNVHWNNSTLTNLNTTPTEVFHIVDNIGDMTFSNVSVENPLSTKLFSFDNATGNTTTIGSLTLDNFRLTGVASASALTRIMDATARTTIGLIDINGLGVNLASGSTFTLPRVLDFTSSSTVVGKVVVSNVDYSHITNFVDATVIPTPIASVNGQFYESNAFSGRFWTASSQTPYLGNWLNNVNYSELGFNGIGAAATEFIAGRNGAGAATGLRYQVPTGDDHEFYVNGALVAKIDATGCSLGCGSAYAGVTSLYTGAGANAAGLTMHSTGGAFLPANTFSLLGNHMVSGLNVSYDTGNWIYGAVGPIESLTTLDNGAYTNTYMSSGINSTAGATWTGHDTTDVNWYTQTGKGLWVLPGTNAPTWPTNGALVANPTANWYVDTSGNTRQALGSVSGWNGDTGLSRDSAGVVDVGNGTAGNTTGTVKAQVIALPIYSSGGLITFAANTGISGNLGSMYLGNGTAGDRSATVYAGSFLASAGFQAYALSSATAGANFNSPPMTVSGNYWNGSSSIQDAWNMKTILGAGTNPTSTLSFVHSGSSGSLNVSLPATSIPSSTIALLPSATLYPAGTVLMVSDATTFTVGACVGGGTDTMLAISNGTTWSCH